MLLKDLIKFANQLDSSGLKKEADAVDDIINGIRQLLKERSGKPLDEGGDKKEPLGEEEEGDQLDFFGLKTNDFDICPKAIEAFSFIKSALGDEPEQGAKDLASKTIELLDKLFQLEKNVLKSKSVTTVELDEAYELFQKISYNVGLLSSEMKEDLFSKFNFLKGHMEKINSFKSRETKGE